MASISLVHRRYLKVLMTMVLALAAGLVVWLVDWSGLREDALQVEIRRKSLTPLSREAERLSLDWATVMKNPITSQNKPVRWRLTHPQQSEFYYEGDFHKTIRWHGEVPFLPLTGPSGHPPWLVVLARIRAAAPPNTVFLEFLGGAP